MSASTRLRRLWTPESWSGNYRAPRVIVERLQQAISHFRNRDAVFKLAIFLARYHSGPKTIGRQFVIDRRRLDGHPNLGLTEARIRGAIKGLLEIGFMEVATPDEAPERNYGCKERAVLFYRFSGEFAKILTSLSRKAKNGAVRANYPQSNKETHEVGHLGEKPFFVHERRDRRPDPRVSEHPYFAARGFKPALKRDPLSDGQIWQGIEREIVKLCGGYTPLYGHVVDKLDEAMQSRAINAERARQGSGIVAIRDALKFG